MVYAIIANQKFMFVLKLAGAALLACLLWNARAYAHHLGESSDSTFTDSLQPSPGHEGWNRYQRQQEAQDNERRYQESQDRYRYSSPPSSSQRDRDSSNPYNYPTPTYTPNGTVLCQEGFQGARYCR